MSHITYHYLINGWNDLQGNYLCDANHLPDKALQEKVYHKYTDNAEHRLEKEGALDVLNEYKKCKTLKEKANFIFKINYNNQIEPILKRPYFGVWGIYTMPIDTFGYLEHHKYRIRIDCDTIDPGLIIIRFGRNTYPYNESNWNKICKPYETPGYFMKVKDKASFREFPTVIFFLPRLKFTKEDIEVYKK